MWGIVSLSVVALTGWVFYLTGNPWSFLILIAIPSLKSRRNDDEDKEE